ncbi:heme-binding protein [Bradyrhizobium huanghuaihaiense]|uniref:heme-binding protein n=1 Tax=Bradyrhizobium huanghuaihaiense TaxID=990078 RepID=UPI0021AADFC7|nr:heme-binding protein [Bradyrhizobium sp. CB3035]UWU81482.1 heme-binding protein [Bradyrhizobium sp. CB3035]
MHGNIILKYRMNGVPVFAADLSERKAYTSALVGLRTADIFLLVQPGQPLFPLMGVSGGRYCSMGGGAPLVVEGQLVAGVGVSGGTVEQDVDILESALRESVAADKSDMKLEVVVIPVSDVDRAKLFYSGLGWRLDIDYATGDDYRMIQFTPAGSGCSIIFGTNVTTPAPGSAKGLHLIVSDIEATRFDLLRRGVAISELFHDACGVFHHVASKDLVSGPNPGRKSYASYASFSDPDGNAWVFQEVTPRLTGHIAPGDTSFTPELTNVVRGASAPKPGTETSEGSSDLTGVTALLQPKLTGETYVQ